VHSLTDPEKLSEEKGKGGNERGGQPSQSATHDGIGVDTDDGKENGEASGPYDCIEGGGYEVVRCDAVELGEVRGVFYVHEHASNLDDQTEKGCKRDLSYTKNMGGTKEGKEKPMRRPTNSETNGARGGRGSCI
jgi:hypothetical protein